MKLQPVVLVLSAVLADPFEPSPTAVGEGLEVGLQASAVESFAQAAGRSWHATAGGRGMLEWPALKACQATE